jgi:hypothetical protein
VAGSIKRTLHAATACSREHDGGGLWWRGRTRTDKLQHKLGSGESKDRGQTIG